MRLSIHPAPHSTPYALSNPPRLAPPRSPDRPPAPRAQDVGFHAVSVMESVTRYDATLQEEVDEDHLIVWIGMTEEDMHSKDTSVLTRVVSESVVHEWYETAPGRGR